ncbi:hypothetical protein ASG43_08565 [Aureimonas sp. Leaf454]|uniref:ATPase inhibitor subunit zeta n=1 Tax=Aureimonas sp. Leaf454 TaxID=1736381 RepID=UPI0006F2F6D2|nr:ATPase inhibitor subunit zeta [Aureimonas sp. Leaf454]KQT48885.1 hypothetical protein ASG43_08565 [Aureimonas sp. Leaf454]
MKSIAQRNDMAERCFLMQEERSFRSRAKIDREIGHWIAGRLGLSHESAQDFAEEAVAAGIRSVGGRGGFDHLSRFVDRAGLHVEALRTRYSIALAGASLAPLSLGDADVMLA